jgi:hypothetical protein
MTQWKSVLMLLFVSTSVFAQSLPSKQRSKKEKVLALIDSSTIQYPKVAKKIFLAETAHGKSKLFKQHANCFGFRINSRKLHSKNVRGYCGYSSIPQSIEDYRRWEAVVVSRFNLNTRDKFLRFVARTYAKNDRYLKLLNGIQI